MQLLADKLRRGWVLLFLLAAWPPSVWALEQTRNLDLFGLPWAQLLMSGVVSLWGSMARTNQRAKDADAVKERFETWREFLRDAWRSSVIGAVIYLTAVSQGWSDWQLGGTLLIAGYSGPAALDLWSKSKPKS